VGEVGEPGRRGIRRPGSPTSTNSVVREAGIRAGTAVVHDASRIVVEVHDSLATEEIEQVDLLIRVVSGFDPRTADHLEAVGTLAMLLAHRLAFPMETVGACLLAGRVHDIGKLAISRSILLKADPPTKADWEELKLLPVHGRSTLDGLPRLRHLAPYVLAVHERLDGLGYPYGSAGREIPSESQIVSIADAFCAMTVARPYAPARMPHEALYELERCADTQFNSEYVEAFCAMVRDRT
jgi:HD-GYP domain-containing protein (c-di-GMP phosphodiesterase class II)